MSCLNQGSCVTPSGTALSGGYLGSQSACENCGDCGSCSVSGHTDESSCKSASGTWTKNTFTPNTVVDATEYTTDDTCNDASGFWWKNKNWWSKKNAWDVGSMLPGFPMSGWEYDGTCTGDKNSGQCQSCSENFPTGDFAVNANPSNLLEEHIIKGDYVKDTQFINDTISGVNATVALAKHPNYYAKLRKWLKNMSSVKVSASDAAGASKQKIIFGHSGLTILFKPENAGSIETVSCGVGSNYTCPAALTPNDLHSLVIEPLNYNRGDNEILFANGKVTVAGGTNHGKIRFTTSGAVRISDINNTATGTVEFVNSKAVFISGLPNYGTITFKDTKTTFVDVINEGGSVTIEGGKYTPYGVVNKGTITVKAGITVSGHIKCNQGGTIIIEAGVNGSATVGSGDCMGTISGAGASVISASSAPEFVVAQELTFTGENVTAASLDNPAAKKSIRVALASEFSVTTASVEIVSINDATARKLRERALAAATTVKIDYEITVSDSAKQADVQEKMEVLDTQPVVLATLADVVAVELGLNPGTITAEASTPTAISTTPSPTPVGGSSDAFLGGAATKSSASTIFVIAAGIFGATVLML